MWLVFSNSDKLKCNQDRNGDGIVDKIIAYSDNCAFMFRGNNDGTPSRIKQKTYDFSEINDGSALKLTAFVKVRGLLPGTNLGRTIVKFSDGQKAKLNLLVTGASSGYFETSSQVIIELNNRSIVKVKTVFFFRGKNGKYFVDRVRLLAVQGASLVPPPEAISQ